MRFYKHPPKNVNKLPRWSLVFFGIALCSGALFLFSVFSEDFANRYNSGPGAALRAFLAHLTSWIPFSLAEILLYLTPVVLVLVSLYAFRYYCESWRSVFVFFGSVLSVLSLLFSLFALGFGPGYHTASLNHRLSLGKTQVNEQTLVLTAECLVAELNALAPKLSFDEQGFSVMPYDREGLNDELLAAYEPICERYGFIQRLESRVKPVLASKLLSYTHITGVYSFYTGEANINTHFPDYTTPFTAAHELAHQRGIARENEANFIAFLVCDASRDTYVRYSGYLNLFEYISGALYRTNPGAYQKLVSTLDERIKGELRAYSVFFEPYRDTVASNISSAVNDTYLKLNGNEAGVESYGLVVELAVAYFNP